MSELVRMTARVSEGQAGLRLDVVAAQLFPEHSRSRLKGWILSGELRVDGAQKRPRDKVENDALIEIEADVADEVSYSPQAIDLNVVHEDEDLLVLDKPAGLVVHPGSGNPDGTLLNALLHRDAGQGALPRAGIVHRLDKDNSGLMVVARTLRAHTHLVDQLQTRTVHREYMAVASGWVTGGGTVNQDIGRHPTQRKKMAVVHHGGKAAITNFRVERRFGHYTCLKVMLETGRTHQIRVHMAHLQHPLIGDPQYGGRPRIPPAADTELIDALRQFPRQALHARKLSLTHPGSGEEICWEAPLPADLVGLLSVLEKHDPPG
jgi:23S rRNA pseudouridine1911/1915/1917 synthase